jgi:hypothetical protein
MEPEHTGAADGAADADATLDVVAVPVGLAVVLAVAVALALALPLGEEAFSHRGAASLSSCPQAASLRLRGAASSPMLATDSMPRAWRKGQSPPDSSDLGAPTQ